MHGLHNTCMHLLHACRPQESGAKTPERLMQPDKVHFDTLVQHTDAPVIAAVQWQRRCMQQTTSVDHLLERATLRAKGITRQAVPKTIFAACRGSLHCCHPV